MGLLDRWTKKKKQEQLEKVEESAKVSGASKKPTTAKKTQKKQVKKEQTTKVETKKSLTKEVDINSMSWEVLVRPIVSEKAADLEAKGIYSFVVAGDANKTQIKKAIKDVYKVSPKKVRVANYDGKRVRFGRYMGRRTNWKKALVFLQKDQRINIHEGV